MKSRIAIVGLAALVMVRSVSEAADVKLDVSANRSSMYLGECLILTVKVSGMGSPPQPDLSAITNATVRLLGSQGGGQYAFTLTVNGKVMAGGFSGRAFIYEIRPFSPGRFVAGPVSLTLDGQTLSQPGPAIEIAGVETQEWAIVTISASRDAVLVDEPFDIILTLLLKRLKPPNADVDPLDPGDPPSLNVAFLDDTPVDGLDTPKVIDMLSQRLVRERNAPGFTINNYAAPRDMSDMDSFFGQKKARFLLERRMSEKDGKTYFEYTIKLAYVPKQEGSYTFGPAEFKGKMIAGVDAQGHGMGKTIFAVGPACTVRVVPPPEEGRPSSYVGALSTNLQVDASLDTQTCNVGDPLKLTLSLSGNARMENVSPPPVGLQPDLGRNFRINDDTIDTVTKENRKDFIYTVRPTKVGTYEFPPVEVSFYDTRERRYRTVKTQPIPIRANETLSVQPSNIIYIVTNRLVVRDTEAADAASLVPGPLNVDPAGAAPCPLGPRPWHIALMVLGPALYVSVVLGRYVRRNIPQMAAAGRRRHASRSALNRLREAGQTPAHDPGATHRMICDALKGYLGERFDVPSAGLTPADARALLAQKIGDVALADAFGSILERHFNAVFSQTLPHDDSAEQDIRAASEVIQEIEKTCGSKAGRGQP